MFVLLIILNLFGVVIAQQNEAEENGFVLEPWVQYTLLGIGIVILAGCFCCWVLIECPSDN